MKWVSGAGNTPLKSESGLYIVQLLASPKGHFLASFRPSLNLIEMRSVGEPRATIEEAVADADADLARLEAQVAVS